MFIALLKTDSNQIAIEVDDFGQAVDTLHNMMENVNNIKKAQILETNIDLDDQCPDFDSCKLVISMGTLR